ncbi:MAG TPA: nucleotidyltransferase family protein [Chloroflexota bacterium]|nr:nucleotidyltransferase family protein [Chloroflexota bacterium]
MQGIILAGGRGERLRPLTDERPKCLVEVAGETIVGYQLRWLAANGIVHAVISCGYRAEMVRAAVGDGTRFGLRVSYAIEHEPLGSGGGLRLAAQGLAAGEEPIVAVNGDVLTALNLRTMAREHRKQRAAATILLVPLVSEKGIVDLDGEGRITAFREKPPLPYLMNAGVYVMSGEALAALPARGSVETHTWPSLARRGLLRGYPYRGMYCTVDSQKDLATAEQRLSRRGLAR